MGQGRFLLQCTFIFNKSEVFDCFSNLINEFFLICFRNFLILTAESFSFLSYDLRAVRKTAPAVSIKGRTGYMLDFTSNRYVPGPGQYNTKDPKHITTSYSFGHLPTYNSNKQKQKYEVPGPGTYKIRDDFGLNAKSVSILGRNELGSKAKSRYSDIPGPGTYDPIRFGQTHGPAFSLKGAVSEDPIMREK